MLDTQSVKHSYKKFFMMPDDLLDIAKRFCWRIKCSERHAYPFATELRVLETWTDDLLKRFAEAGLTAEHIHEEMLWIDTEWQPFCARALHLFEARTFQKTLPRLIQAGYARQRYIKRDASGQRVCGENEQPLVYDTYQHARNDKQHPGEIIHQVLFLSDAVNKDIAALSAPTPPTQPPTTPSPDPKTKKGDSVAQGGNLVSQSPSEEQPGARGGNPDTPSVPGQNIPHPSQNCEGLRSVASQNSHYGRNTVQKCEGGGSGQNTPSMPRKNAQDPSHMCEEASQKCDPPVGKNASNKNLNKEIREESNQESLISAAGAAGPLFDFDFSQSYSTTAILQLATRLMPLKEEYKSESRRQTALLSTEQTAEKLAQNDLLRERGLRHFARLLAYFADPGSPCKWRAYIQKRNPGFQPRLWHLQDDDVVRLANREMEACDWWPVGFLPASVNTPQSFPSEEQEVVDLAELAGVAPENRVGMDRKEARGLVVYVRDLLHGIPRLFVDSFLVDQQGRDRSRGSFVDFCCEKSPMLRLYSLADWDLIAEHAAYLNEPDFVQRLADALRNVSIA